MQQSLNYIYLILKFSFIPYLDASKPYSGNLPSKMYRFHTQCVYWKSADSVMAYSTVATPSGHCADKAKCFWFGLMLNVPVNNFSVMLGRS